MQPMDCSFAFGIENVSNADDQRAVRSAGVRKQDSRKRSQVDHPSDSQENEKGCQQNRRVTRQDSGCQCYSKVGDSLSEKNCDAKDQQRNHETGRKGSHKTREQKEEKHSSHCP